MSKEQEKKDLVSNLLDNEKYFHIRILKTGEIAGIHKMMFTTGLFVGLDEIGYRTRFCYRDQEEAEQAIETWDGIGDPPGMWIKEKGRVERLGPGAKI